MPIISMQGVMENTINRPVANTDKEVWSRDTREEPFQSYASVRINQNNSAMTLCLGGTCCTMSIDKWHKIAMEVCNNG